MAALLKVLPLLLSCLVRLPSHLPFPLQICWKWRKVMTAKPQKGTFRAFLDSVQYSRTGILRYERIFGPGFVSTGGLETTKVCLQLCTCS